MILSEEIASAANALINSPKTTMASSAATLGLGISGWLELIRGPASVVAILMGIVVSYSLYRRNQAAAALDEFKLQKEIAEAAHIAEIERLSRRKSDV